jgi:hypothetical protein
MAGPTVNISPNMLLPVPIPTIDLGPDWAFQVYNCLYSQIDAHDHSLGKGVAIQPDGLNISSALTFQGNSATNLLTSGYVTQSAPLSPTPYPYSVYVSGGNLYYNNASTSIQITTPTAVNSTSSGISSPPASASFVSGILVVNQNTNTPGNIAAGSIMIGDNTPGSNYVTISAATGTSGYPITLPSALPSQTVFVTESQFGQLSGVPYPLTGSSIAANTVATSNLVAAVYGSISVGGYSNSTTGFTTISSLNGVVGTGRPMIVTFVTNNSSSNGAITVVSNDSDFPNSGIAYIRLLIDGTTQSITTVGVLSQVSGVNAGIYVPPSSVSFVIPPGTTSGYHDYEFQGAIASTGTLGNLSISNCNMVLYEI